MKLINNKGIPTLIISEEEAFVVKNFIDTIFTSDFVGQDDSITRVAIEDFPCGEIVKSGRKYHGFLYDINIEGDKKWATI